ncbi:MAG: DoxX family membrane protein [Bacteroidetes bacterium]|nr:MAG: DoxX family membrane protein [Bacteroidota bacterium]
MFSFFLQPILLLPILASLFLAILFLQSGLDKVFAWQGNLSWLEGHFSKTFLRTQVKMMLGVITFTEVAAGVLCALGVFEILFFKTAILSLLGGELASLTLVMLFFGQRIAQDYVGAAGLVPYFVMSLISNIMFALLTNYTFIQKAVGGLL